MQDGQTVYNNSMNFIIILMTKGSNKIELHIFVVYLVCFLLKSLPHTMSNFRSRVRSQTEKSHEQLDPDHLSVYVIKIIVPCGY